MPAPTPLKGQDLDRSDPSDAGVGPTGRAHAAREKVTCSAIPLMGFGGSCASLPARASPPSYDGNAPPHSESARIQPGRRRRRHFSWCIARSATGPRCRTRPMVDYPSCSSPIRHGDVAGSGVPPEGAWAAARRQPRAARVVSTRRLRASASTSRSHHASCQEIAPDDLASSRQARQAARRRYRQR